MADPREKIKQKNNLKPWSSFIGLRQTHWEG